MHIQYPDFLEQKLGENRELRSAIDSTVADLEVWITDSKLPFFPDYTDHGPDHLNQVLTTATALMTEESRELFSAGDAAILILATLLHDSAMHLSEAGLWDLIKGKAARQRIQEFDSNAWPDQWQDFLFAAKRWDEGQLIRIFGESRPGVPRANVRDPFENYDNLSDTDRRLIGEFIRNNHVRMAHEFAVFGVPGPTDNPIKPDNRFSQALCDIAGLVARSHGLPARACIDYLTANYHRREYQQVHAVFLMTLLRIADYLQIQASRAPLTVFRYKHIPSKISRQEWKAHQAITNITQTNDDPESIEIQASPQDVRTFLRLKQWLGGIQAELDASWAVLGEVYGSHKKLRRLGLIIRRVRSNLDEVTKFAKTVHFVPRRIEFDVERPDLLKLLIRPLYGDKPEVGIRELMQNAVDAVRELWMLQEKRPDLRYVPLIEQDGDVQIWLDDPDETGWAWLTISDRGIGMTADVVKNYFLKAGASYRSSYSWQKEFESDNEISDRQIVRSRVLRSGRFGVGVLAAFLLGEEFEVATRHVLSSYGIRFKTRLDLDPIELAHDPSLSVGTSIRILLSPETQMRLRRDSDTRWDWFCFDKPKVRRLVGSTREPLPQRYLLTYDDFQKPSKWRKFDAAGYAGVFWTYDNAPDLNCNGIFIRNLAANLGHFPKRVIDDRNYTIKKPQITVLDPDGRFPLNLHRNGLDVDYDPFENDLWKEILCDVLGYLLINTPYSLQIDRLLEVKPHPALQFTYYSGHKAFHPWFLTKEGLGIVDAGVLQQIDIKSILILASDNDTPLYTPLGEEVHDGIYTFIGSTDETNLLQLLADYLNEYSSTAQLLSGRPGQLLGLRFFTTSTFANKLIRSKSFYNKLKDKYGRQENLKNIRERLGFELTGRHWSILATQSCPQTLIQVDSFQRQPMAPHHKPKKQSKRPTYSWESNYTMERETKHPCALELFLTTGRGPWETRGRYVPRQVFSELGRLWRQVICYPVIPFDPEERRTKLASAFRTLAPYISIHEAIRKTKQ